MINDMTERRIKESTPIDEVFRHYGFDLKRNGNGYLTKCPFHEDKHPSMSISTAKNICKCFSCGDGAMDPVGFIMRYEGVNYPDALRTMADICNIPIMEEPEYDTPRMSIIAPLPSIKHEMQPTYMDKDVMLRTMKMYQDNPLYCFISSLFGKELTLGAFLMYNVGTANFVVNANQGNRKSVVFWQVDEMGAIRGGKIVPYDESTGRRIKDTSRRDAMWAHTAMRIKNYNLRQCLFGQHLLSEDKSRVNIVESEKTAILAHLYFGGSRGRWMATGGKDTTTAKGRILDASDAIYDKEIVLYPDADGIEEWGALCGELRGVGFNVSVSRVMDNFKGSKIDIGDMIINKMYTTVNYKEQLMIIQQEPRAAPLSFEMPNDDEICPF